MALTSELLQAYSFDPISIVVFTQYDFTDFDCTLLYCMYVYLEGVAMGWYAQMAQRWRLCRWSNAIFINTVFRRSALWRSFVGSSPVRSVHCMKRAEMQQAGVKATSLDASSSSKVGKRVSSNRYLKVLGTGGSDTPPCVYLFTDNQRYLFNCGDNTERFCLEHKLRVSKLRNVFFTRTHWDCVGGLPGLVMHMRDSSLSELSLNLYGPQGLVGYDRAIAYVVNKTNLHFNLNVLSESCAIMYKDDDIQVTGVLLETDSNGGSSASESYSSDDEELERKEPSAKRSKSARPSFGSVVYLCELADIPGKFDRSKAQALGLPPGPLYAKLVQGNSVVTPEGREVKSSDVMGPPFVGPLFMIIDCPSEQALAQLLANEQLQKFHKKDCSKRPSLVIHMTPRELAEREDYTVWAGSFDPLTQHLFLHSTICPEEHVFRANLKIQAPLNSIFPGVFSVPGKEVPRPPLQLPPALEKQARSGRVMLMYHFYPSKVKSWDESELLLPVDECCKEHMKTFEENETLKLKLRDSLKEAGKIKPMEGSGGKGVMVTFLGTGAALPSRYRNVSSTLLQLTSGDCLLLDCGEGTLQQLFKCFGAEEASMILQRMGCVFVSHIHGDHNLGLIRLLKHRYELLKQHKGKCPRVPLILGPFALNKMLREYSNHCERLFYRFMPNLKCNSDCEGVPDVIAAAAEMGLKELKPVYVKHCYDSHGLAVTDASTGHRVIFSGDTRPCPKLSEFGKGAKLLIHEGTFEDDLQEEAVAKKHCTVSEALGVSKQMEAEHVVLTHFSQRYPKVPAGMLTGSFAGLQVGLAFDCMHVHLDHMDCLYDIMPVVRDILAELVDDGEQTSRHSVQLPSWD